MGTEETGKENFEQEEVSVNGMFCKPHVDSAKAEWVCGTARNKGTCLKSR